MTRPPDSASTARAILSKPKCDAATTAMRGHRKGLKQSLFLPKYIMSAGIIGPEKSMIGNATFRIRVLKIYLETAFRRLARLQQRAAHAPTTVVVTKLYSEIFVTPLIPGILKN